MECLHDLLATEKLTRGITGKANHAITLSDTLPPRIQEQNSAALKLTKYYPFF